MRLIDADALKTTASIQRANFNTIKTVRQWIDEAPTIDPAVVRHGHWIVSPKTQEGYCSECKHDMPVMMDDWHYKKLATEYCPSCGAKMDGEEP